MIEADISTDRDRLDVDLIHRFLSEQSHWARGIPRETVERSIAGSLCFGAYLNGRQVGFARVISDFATFGWLVDVFVLPERRGQGIGKRLVDAVVAHPDLQGLRRFGLTTADAHGLYARYGFANPRWPERFMERFDPELYRRSDAPPDLLDQGAT